MATENAIEETRLDRVVELKLCRRHVRQGPIWMEDSIKAAAMYGIKATLKEDSASCFICVARAAALNRIKAAGGDGIKAAEDSESRARDEICVKKRVGRASKEEGLMGVMKQTVKVPHSYIRWLLTASPLTPFRLLSEDYFQRNPQHRVSILSSAFLELSRIYEMDNIMYQFFEKGYAMVELQVDYATSSD